MKKKKKKKGEGKKKKKKKQLRDGGSVTSRGRSAQLPFWL